MEYLVESALLTHGLKSVSNETIKKEWQNKGIGKQVWNLVCSIAKCKHIKYIELCVSKKTVMHKNFIREIVSMK